MTQMEIEGMKHGCFNMAKEDGAKACKEYRAELEAVGCKTRLEHFSGDLYIVRISY